MESRMSRLTGRSFLAGVPLALLLTASIAQAVPLPPQDLSTYALFGIDGLLAKGMRLSSGNIGVNLAAGVGNQQINALTIASSSTGSAPVAPTGGGGGTPGV